MQSKSLAESSNLKVQDGGAIIQTTENSQAENAIQDPELLKAIELKNAINVF